MNKTEYNFTMKNDSSISSEQDNDVPSIKDLGSVSDLTDGIGSGGGKEPGGFDGDFAPLQIS